MLEPTEPASTRAAREAATLARVPDSRTRVTAGKPVKPGRSVKAGKPAKPAKPPVKATRAAKVGKPGKTPSSAGPLAPGPRSGRRKKGLLRRTGVVVPAIGVAVVLVAAVTVVSYEMSPKGSGATALTPFMSSLPTSGSIAALEAERQQLIVMNAAAQTLSTVSKPAMVDPAKVVASQQAAQQAASGNGSSSTSNSGTSGSSSGSSGSSSGGAPPAAAPSPGSAQRIAFDMLPSFGFNQTTQFSCLVSLWNRESGWRWDAENASGAYGIPQSLPGSKMASAGSDWQTNPATQIKWGLGYISQVYGTPCGAWGHEEADGWY